MQENKRYKGLKTGKWISIRSLVPGLLLTVRSASLMNLEITFLSCDSTYPNIAQKLSFSPIRVRLQSYLRSFLVRLSMYKKMKNSKKANK